jgi:hypothetical protein
MNNIKKQPLSKKRIKNRTRIRDKNKNKNKIKKTVKKLVNVVKTISGIQSNKPTIKSIGSGKSNGTFKDCLKYPKNILARTPRSLNKSVVAHYTVTVNMNANASGSFGFVFAPFLIDDIGSVASGSTPLWTQTAPLFDGITPEIATGYTAQTVRTPINSLSFSGARSLSSYIEVVPNLSLTNAQGRGFIAMGPVKTTARLMNPTATSAADYSQLQLIANMQRMDYYADCYVNKMQGLSGHWIPYEAQDILEYPPINYNTSADIPARHPQENMVFGGYFGLPANTSIAIRMTFNVELIVDATSSTNGLFPLLAELSSEMVDPVKILSEVYHETVNFVHMLDMNSQEN